MKVSFVVPNRPQWNNTYWALRKQFPSGANEVEVTPEEFEELKADPVLLGVQEVVVEDAPLDAEDRPIAVDPDAAPPPPRGVKPFKSKH